MIGGSNMKLHGIKIPHCKNTADSVPVRILVPKTVTIPMSMHIGKPAEILVKRGDTVKVGQLIGKADGFISSHVHSSVSGTVRKIDQMISSNGSKVDCAIIDSDGKQELADTVKPPFINDFDSFINAVRESGVVGLGGAGFPSFAKLKIDDLARIQTVVINAAECEPYITSDTRTMLDKTDFILKGISAIKKYMNVKDFVIGIETNKPAAIQKMNELAEKESSVRVHVLPSMYPQGGEKVLVYNTLKKIIPRGHLPIEVGVIVINITTLAFIGEYLETGIPLIEKCITIDGSAVKEPKNVIAPIGTHLSDLIESAGGLKSEPAKVMYGGPMMGIAVPSLDEPVLKNTNAVIFMDKKQAAMPKTTACINCGACLSHCPFRLDPRSIALAYKLSDCEALQKLCVDMCMECGCCSYICPANRPLVQTNKLAKIKLREYLKDKKGV